MYYDFLIEYKDFLPPQYTTQSVPEKMKYNEKCFIEATKPIKTKVERNLNLLKLLTQRAILSNIKYDEILAIKDAKVVILN